MLRHILVVGRDAFPGRQGDHRPLLRAASREFDVTRHTSQQISQRIRASDSQPGVLSRVFGTQLYIYGGMVDETMTNTCPVQLTGTSTVLLGMRDNSACVAAADGKGVWITHVRRPKGRSDEALWPKVPAVPALKQMGISTA